MVAQARYPVLATITSGKGSAFEQSFKLLEEEITKRYGLAVAITLSVSAKKKRAEITRTSPNIHTRERYNTLKREAPSRYGLKVVSTRTSRSP